MGESCNPRTIGYKKKKCGKQHPEEAIQFFFIIITLFCVELIQFLMPHEHVFTILQWLRRNLRDPEIKIYLSYTGSKIYENSRQKDSHEKHLGKKSSDSFKRIKKVHFQRCN